MIYSIRGDHRAYPALSGARASTIIRHFSHDHEAPGFLPLNVVAMRPDAGLTIVIHPGDLLENGWGYATSAQASAVRAFGAHNAQGMGRGLKAARARGDDIIVLHRESSLDFFDGGRRSGVGPTLWKAHICPLMRTATALWGDDLDEASSWLVAHAHLATRPFVHMAGAYACPDHGCLTAIAKALLAHTPSLALTVSPFSPPANGPGDVWRPTGVVPMDVPDSIQHLYTQAFGL